MKVAHIGATGNVGSKVLEELLRRGHTVTAIARNPEKAPASHSVRPVRGDITAPDKLVPVIAGHDGLGSDPLTAADGTSSISYEYYAIALVDELEKPRHLRRRFTIGY